MKPSCVKHQDKFKFLASKLSPCSKLTSHVIVFSSPEVILGKGVLGEVKLATFVTLGIPVAVKVELRSYFCAISEARVLQHLAGHMLSLRIWDIQQHVSIRTHCKVI